MTRAGVVRPAGVDPGPSPRGLRRGPDPETRTPPDQPVCLSMIACDQVVFDPADGKPSVPGAVRQVPVDFREPLDVRITGARLESLVLTGPGSVVFRRVVADAVSMERRVRIHGRDRT